MVSWFSGHAGQSDRGETLGNTITHQELYINCVSVCVFSTVAALEDPPENTPADNPKKDEGDCPVCHFLEDHNTELTATTAGRKRSPSNRCYFYRGQLRHLMSPFDFQMTRTPRRRRQRRRRRRRTASSASSDGLRRPSAAASVSKTESDCKVFFTQRSHNTTTSKAGLYIFALLALLQIKNRYKATPPCYFRQHAQSNEAWWNTTASDV